ncbi:hypothetical protein FA10DRAFT_273936 [Acaromyces ingoldii]|uniref:PIN domain-like protein n=1 Tax=Acaromyces ingoldii TaxID=215250 RepID=A0A316YVL3_9BASI|nr:hypothetical protein FA10DRAFT_273936 [Acaromyces ingoldii]PWN93477.1 hypothetical protein FA10DRAFT_273936 [Acaromyces ingoldii]
MITGLEEYLRVHQLLHTLPLSSLKDTRLGIDLNLYLKTLLQSPSTSEPLVTALGGSPLALISHIENDLRTLERARIKPVFVLGGLQLARRTRPFSFEDPRVEERRKAWESYEQSDTDGAHVHFSRSNSTQVGDLVRAVLRAFRHRNVEFLVAPYLAEGQLVSLERHSKSYIHSIYSSSDVFLFDRVDKVILSLDLQGSTNALPNGSSNGGSSTGSFTYASKAEIMGHLRCNEEEFLDMGLLLGWEHCPTFPPLVDGTIPNANPPLTPLPRVGHQVSLSPEPLPDPRQALDVVRQYRSGYTACTALADHVVCAKLGYVDAFCRARCMIKFCLVTSAEEGRVLPLPRSTPPPPFVAGGVSTASSTAAAPAATVAPGVNGTTPPSIPNSSATSGGAPILTNADVPVDLHEIFSHRLPDEVFLHLSRGLLGSAVLNWLTSGSIIETAPLDEGDTEVWRNFMRNVITESPQSPRCIALALMGSSLNGFWSSRKVFAYYHFDPPNGAPHNVPHDQPTTLNLIKRIDNWNVSVAFVEEELRRQNSSTIDIALCLGATGRGDLAERTKTSRPKKVTPSNAAKEKDAKTSAGSGAAGAGAGGPGGGLEKKDEVVANVIWRMLELRGFLNHDHLHTPYARSLHLALKSARLNDKLQEPLYLALELIRAGILHGEGYSGRTKSGGPTWGDLDAASDSEEKAIIVDSRRHLLLIMRTLCLLPLTYRPLAWSAPLSRELLQFNAFSRALTRSLRTLVEAIASSMLLRGDAKRARDDYLDISLSLPFQSDSSTGLGIVLKCYLEALLTFNGGPVSVGHEADEDVVEAKEAVVSMIEQTFSNIKDIRGEIARGFRFWKAVVKAVEVLRDEKSVSLDIVDQFLKADAWVTPMVF